MIHGSGRSPGEGKDYPLQYSCLENSMDRGVWWATGHGIAKTQTQLRDFHFPLILDMDNSFCRAHSVTESPSLAYPPSSLSFPASCTPPLLPLSGVTSNGKHLHLHPCLRLGSQVSPVRTLDSQWVFSKCFWIG